MVSRKIHLNVTWANSQAYSNFIARTSGLDTTHQGAYATLLNGLTNDGFFDASGNSTLLDCLYILGTQDSTTARLNLVKNSFNATLVGSPTFTADRGYAGVTGTGSCLDTGFVPSTAGGNFTLNSASFGVYNRTARTSGATASNLGVLDSSTNSAIQFQPKLTTNNCNSALSTALSYSSQLNAETTGVQGFWSVVRPNSTTHQIRLYNAANTSGKAFQTDTKSSSALASGSIYICAYNFVGSGAFSASTDQIFAAFIGASLTTTQQNNLASRLNAFATTVGANVW